MGSAYSQHSSVLDCVYGELFGSALVYFSGNQLGDEDGAKMVRRLVDCICAEPNLICDLDSHVSKRALFNFIVHCDVIGCHLQLYSRKILGIFINGKTSFMNPFKKPKQHDLKKIVINADDFGSSPAIDRSIVELMLKKRVSSTSVMSLYYPDYDSLQKLKELRAQASISIGLHLDLTSEQAAYRLDERLSVKQIIIRAWLGRFEMALLEKIIAEQLANFETLFGFQPDFIDGHEHVHQFPQIRTALKNVLKSIPASEQILLRNTHSPKWQGLKAFIIETLGAKAFTHEFGASQFAFNHDFLGVYGLNDTSKLKKYWRNWLEKASNQGALIMCHPSQKFDAKDPIGKARVGEFDWLGSDEFAHMLSEMNIETMPFLFQLHHQ